MNIRIAAQGFGNNKKLIDLLKENHNPAAIAEILHKIGLDIVNDAKFNIVQNGSVRTGNLLNSINILEEEQGKSVTVGTEVEYAPFVEFGTFKQQPKPYLHPAAIRNAKTFKDVYVEENVNQARRRAIGLLDSELLD